MYIQWSQEYSLLLAGGYFGTTKHKGCFSENETLLLSYRAKTIEFLRFIHKKMLKSEINFLSFEVHYYHSGQKLAKLQTKE